MNHRSDIDRTLQTWMADGPHAIPDRVVEVVATRIGVQRQRRARRPWRPTMNSQLKLVAALAAVAVLAVAGWSVLPRDGGVGPPPASPSSDPTSNPSPTPPGSAAAVECEDGIPGCAGPLAAGAHRTANFAPAFSYTTPAGWANRIDTEVILALTPDIPFSPDLILVWSGVVPADHTGTCDLRPMEPAGTTPSDWLSYLTSHPGLSAENAHSLTLNGRHAQAVDVRSLGSWVSPCEADRANFTVPLLKATGTSPADGYGVAAGSAARIYAIDAGDETVIVTVYAYIGGMEALVGAVRDAEPVVLSFDFGS